MLPGLFRWIAGFGVKDLYRAALIKATYPDEQTPDEESIQIILHAFAGKNPQIRTQIAVLQFFKMLDRGDYKIYWTFNIKMLLIIDRCLQQKLILQDISTYQNTFLKEFKENGDSNSNPKINSFVFEYYSYIKEKAKIYNNWRATFELKPKERLIKISKMSISVIHEIEEICCQLHTIILNISSSCKNENKKNPLIQYVFCNLLNTLLSCYTIQSICTSILIAKIPSMKFHQLQAVKSTIHRMNKTTKATIKFVEDNKNLQGFKDIKYKEFFTFDQRILNILDEAFKNFDDERKSHLNEIDEQQWNAKECHLQCSKRFFSKKIYIRNVHFLPSLQRKLIRGDSQTEAIVLFEQFKNIFSSESQNQMVSKGQFDRRSTGYDSNRPMQYQNNSIFDQKLWNSFQNVYS